MSMKIELANQIHAPIDLIWELVVESTFEQDMCPVSGLQGGRILEDYEDGLLKEVIFDGRPLKQRVYINDDSYEFRADFSGDQDSGSVINQLTDLGGHLTRMKIECDWDAPDLTDLHKRKLYNLFEEQLKCFKQSTEELWAEKASSGDQTSHSAMH